MFTEEQFGPDSVEAVRAAELLEEASDEAGWEDERSLLHLLSFIGQLAKKNPAVLDQFELHLDDAVTEDLSAMDEELGELDDDDDDDCERDFDDEEEDDDE